MEDMNLGELLKEEVERRVKLEVLQILEKCKDLEEAKEKIEDL